MPSAINPQSLDLPLAWRRAVRDLSERRAFVRHPFLDTLVASDLNRWLNDLASAIADGRYAPSSCGLVFVPKPHGHVRPGAVLQLQDQVVYNALLEALRPQLAAHPALGAAAPDYSHHLRADAISDEWFEPFFARWQAFDRDSISSIDAGASWVVVADIAGYYENIDLYTLRSDLNALNADSSVVGLLHELLMRWPRVQRRGLPQGYSPSDLLAKLYLASVDATLTAEGFIHRRWVDDFRIFCTSEADGRRALVLLSETLGRRGLLLQSSKSKVTPGASARAAFSVVQNQLAPVQAAVAAALLAGVDSAPSYLPPWQVDAVLAAHGDAATLAVLKETFMQHFGSTAAEFHKTLFRYVVRRLGAARDASLAGAIVAWLRRAPEEFDTIATYCEDTGTVDVFETEFLRLEGEGLLPYPYLLYQYFRWRVRIEHPLSPAVRTLVRRCGVSAPSDGFVRAAARALLGRLGDPSDLEALEAAYSNAGSVLERAELVCVLTRMESARRNALFGRAAGDGALPAAAVRMARAGQVRFDAC